jgi:DNA replication and repair protein RecF
VLELELEPGVVLVTGANGAGKTNLLESLHVGTQGFSPRARSDAQLVRFGTQAGRVILAGSNGHHRFESDVVLSPREARRATLNGEPLRSAEQLRNELRSLVFTPDRLAIVKGGPATRRAYFDRTLGRLFPARTSLPVEYAAAVGQRNAALRRLSTGDSSRDAVDPWTETVVTLGSALVGARLATLDALSAPFAACADRLGLHAATLEYAGEPPTRAELDDRLEKDVERGVTGAGPHLHDVVVRAGDLELRSFGSQGEQRVAVLALVLAEAETLAGAGGPRPLVLLDDVLSELDEERRRALADLIADAGQTVVTSTSAGVFPAEPSRLLVVLPGTVRGV